jgi:acyl-CoA dehydrogenase
MQGVAIAEAALQQALAYAQDRRQGRTPKGDTAIIDHADVRRMLARMAAETQSARSIGLACAVAIDMARATGQADWAARAAFLTPIAKAYGTDTGHAVAQLGVQVHGGMGFIEETGAAQFARDVRVTQIYEGTNGIQALDLVGRKMMDGGEAAFRLLQEIEDGAEAARAAHPDLATPVWNAAETLREGTEWLLAQGGEDRGAAAVPYLRAFALVLGAHYHLKGALADPARLPLAAVAIRRVLPEHTACLAEAREGSAGLYALSPEALGA